MTYDKEALARFVEWRDGIGRAAALESVGRMTNDQLDHLATQLLEAEEFRKRLREQTPPAPPRTEQKAPEEPKLLNG